MLFSKDMYEKIDSWAEKGHLGKLAKVATENDDEKLRAAAFRAMGKLRAKETVEFLLEALKSDETVTVKKAIAQSLGKIATKAEFDAIYHFSDEETDEEIKEALKQAAVEAKDRSPRW